MRLLLTLAVVGALVAGAVVSAVLFAFTKDLPDHTAMQEYSPPVMSRVYADDGRVLTRFAKEERLFVPYHRIPPLVVRAFISAEDKNFFTHNGIDVTGIFRAAAHNAQVVLTGGGTAGLSGGSTITQQVVKNFLLTNEKTLARKAKEAILALRVSKEFSKEKILELYLNQIYLGDGAYGVAAASLNYFGKPAEKLGLEEAALLASLPKAPSRINPRVYYDRALERRNFVIGRMRDDGYITEEEEKEAKAKPITLARHTGSEFVNGTFFTDVVRQEIITRYTYDALYDGGMSIWTTLRPDYQRIAEKALYDGLTEYDRRHGWRGPIDTADVTAEDWKKTFAGKNYPSSYGWRAATVTSLDKNKADLYFQNEESGILPLSGMQWAAAFKSRNSMGPKPSKPGDVLKAGDVVYVEPAPTKEGAEFNGEYQLRQLPQVEGSIVAMEPSTGRVLALVGGFDYAINQYNRATQAKRQPGSSVKPFVYLSALENGFRPNSIIVDEPISLPLGDGTSRTWNPANHSGQYYGPRTLRYGLEKSLNALTVNLSAMVGVHKISETLVRFGVIPEPLPYLSIALGTTENTLLNMTTAYAMLANGGKKITPSFIEWAQDRHGNVVMRRDERPCESCRTPTEYPPVPVDARASVADPVRAYQMTSMMEGVVQRGTASVAKTLARPLAGKTGTTDDAYDAWFIGFSPNLVVGVYVGFDAPASLGNHEYGSTAALPIWMDFMKDALKDVPPVPFSRPDGVKLVKIDYDTGGFPAPYKPDAKIIYEAFKIDDDPFSGGRDSYFSLGQHPYGFNAGEGFFPPGYSYEGNRVVKSRDAYEDRAPEDFTLPWKQPAQRPAAPPAYEGDGAYRSRGAYVPPPYAPYNDGNDAPSPERQQPRSRMEQYDQWRREDDAYRTRQREREDSRRRRPRDNDSRYGEIY
ncbi:MAG: penicillin-binding protein 1A [Rickettsiales bacterium]